MQDRNQRFLVLLASLLIFFMTTAPAAARLYFYVFNEDGDLLKYDPETDAIAQQLKNAAHSYIQRSDSDDVHFRKRVLDMNRHKLVLVNPRLAGEIVLIDLQQGTATKTMIHSPDSYSEILRIVYPRRASRFYVHWLRKQQQSARDEILFTAIDLTGQILGTNIAPLDKYTPPIFYPDGRHFGAQRAFSPLVTLIDGETLVALSAYDLTPLRPPGVLGSGVPDIRGGRVLVGQGAGLRNDPLDPVSLFTLDLNFAPASATPRISTGIGIAVALLTPDGRTIIAQEARDATSAGGLGRLHFFDVATGLRLGATSFPAELGAFILSYHPDGRRLFINARNLDSEHEVVTNLVVVDVISRTVVRNREIEGMTLVHDFVDEP